MLPWVRKTNTGKQTQLCAKPNVHQQRRQPAPPHHLRTSGHPPSPSYSDHPKNPSHHSTNIPSSSVSLAIRTFPRLVRKLLTWHAKTTSKSVSQSSTIINFDVQVLSAAKNNRDASPPARFFSRITSSDLRLVSRKKTMPLRIVR